MRAAILLAPLAVSFAVALSLGQVLPGAGPDRSLLTMVGRFLVIATCSMISHRLAAGAARRFLPLAALLELTLIFPGEAPSRYSVALKSGTTKTLRISLDAPETNETEAEAARSVLELVAQLNRHDRLTRGHSERVRAYCDLLSQELDLNPADANKLRWAGLLHDVGKIFVPEEILNKPDMPTPEEWETLKAHPEWGAELIAPLADWLGDWGLAVRHHHERWDGEGYPDRLAAEEIPLGARIVAVADAFDVMTSHRSYQKPRSHAEARSELVACQSTQFDPAIVRAFLSISVGRLHTATGLLSAPASFLGINPAAGAAGSRIAPAFGSVVVATGTSVAVLVGGLLDVPGAYSPPETNDQVTITVPENGPPTTRVIPPTPPRLRELQEVTVTPGSTTTIELVERLETGIATTVQQPITGAVTDKGDGSIDYRAPVDFIGHEQFTVEVCRDGGSCSTTLVSIDVQPPALAKVTSPVPEQPLASGPTTAAQPRRATTTTRPDADPLFQVETSATTKTNPAVVTEATTPAVNQEAAVNEAAAAQVPAVPDPIPQPTTTLLRTPTTVAALGQPTTTAANGGRTSFEVIDDSADSVGAAAFTIAVLSNDSSFDGTPLQVTGIEPDNKPLFGSASVSADGQTISYKPDLGFSGEDRFSYRVGNGNGVTDTGAVKVTVLASSDPNLVKMVHSTTPDRQGATYHFSQLAQQSYIFVQPATGVREVRWYIDDPARAKAPFAVRTEAPFDLSGTDATGAPLPLAALNLKGGGHTVTAEVVMGDSTKTRNESFVY